MLCGCCSASDAPVFASKPHFLDADPAFLHNVTGLSPDRAKHDSYLDVEPVGGGGAGLSRKGVGW